MKARSLLPAGLALHAMVAVPWPGEARAPQDWRTVPILAAGSKVRLAAPSLASGRISGIVREADAESLVVDVRGAAPVSVPLGSITRLEVSTGRHRQTLLGLAVGAGIGALVVGNHPCVNEGCSRGFSGEFALIGGLAGAVPGAVIGALVKKDRWTAVALDHVQVTCVPALGRGRGLMVSIGF